MSAAHTPGPWARVPGFHQNRVEAADGVAVGYALGRNAEAEANAHLIAAAPALLEALAWLESYLRDTPHHNAPAAANARAVISLARGEAK